MPAKTRLAYEARKSLVQRYAAGELSWHELQLEGFADYVEVLALLGELGLRPPLASPGGVNAAARERGVSMLKRALRIAS